MDDLDIAAPRPGKATQRHLHGGRDGEDLIVPVRDPETGGPSPAGKALEIQPGPSIPVMKAGPRSGLQRALSRDGISWPCLNMSPRLQGLILLNLVRFVLCFEQFSNAKILPCKNGYPLFPLLNTFEFIVYLCRSC